jgi:hypothetical protein
MKEAIVSAEEGIGNPRKKDLKPLVELKRAV